jgi:hypothetical protein
LTQPVKEGTTGSGSIVAVRLINSLVVPVLGTVDVVIDVRAVRAVGMIIMSTAGGHPHLE